MVRSIEIPETPPVTNAIELVETILAEALRAGASDVHAEPMNGAFEIRFRVDGLLVRHATQSVPEGRSIVARLMVMASLLTYRLDVPQEGRLTVANAGQRAMELRLSVMPTTHGLRAAIRMPAELIQPRTLAELGLPATVIAGLEKFARADSGMLIVTGPAGSGKTTTIYALLEQIARTQPGLSIVSLEDPVERDIPGVTQIEVTPFGLMTYDRALRSMLRQDPQVLMLGEIRDAETASLAVQAALSGHRLLCTLHAASPGGAMSRLLEMGLEPYRITGALFGIVGQRLLRKRTETQSPRYRGRIPAAEFVAMSQPLRAAVLARADADELQRAAAIDTTHVSLLVAAKQLAAAGITDNAEVERVFGSET